jgi:putative DNA primase/helicase
MKNANKTSASIPDLSDAFIQGILDSESHFYTYGTTIVEPITDPDSGTGRLRTITVPDLKWYVRRVFPDEYEGTISAVAEDVLHNPELPLQRIRGLVTTPTFREDFSLITVPGFDTASGLYYSPDPSLHTFSFETDASKEKAKGSLNLLFELLKDFPFRNENERYSYLATLLTLFLRSSIRGVVPCLAIDGNGKSVGKSLLSSILSLIAYGQDAATTSAPKGREEWASKLDSILLKGSPFQVIDNIVGAFSSDDFASILTSTRRNIRIKGLSKVVDVPVNTVWVLNGNDLSVDSDLSQRLIMCHLQHEDAASRRQETFQIQKVYGCSIEVLLHQERAKYMQACLDVICAWVNEGATRRKKLVLAKYGEWESVVGGIIDWIAPEVRFLADHQKETLAVDAERDETIIFLRHLMLEFPRCDTDAVGVSQITSKVFPDFGSKSALRDFVPDALLGLNGSSFAKKLGRWLKRVSTRRWGSIELIPVEDKHEGVWKYRIGENIKNRSTLEGLVEDTDTAAA